MASELRREFSVGEKKRRELDNLDHWYRKQRSLARHAVEHVMFEEEYIAKRKYIERKYENPYSENPFLDPGSFKPLLGDYFGSLK